MESESQKVVRELYSKDAEGYDVRRLIEPKGKLLTDRDMGIFLDMLPDSNGNLSALEVGAGTGRFTVPVLEHGYNVLATELNDTMLQLLKKKLGHHEKLGQCGFQQETAFDLTMSSNSFALVYCMHVVPRFLNWSDQEKALTELCRVTEQQGYLLFNFRNSRNFINAIYRGHSVDIRKVKKFLLDAGFTIIKVRSKPFITRTLLDMLPLPVGKIAMFLDRKLEALLPGLGWDVYILAQKKSQ